jgi:uncharacterized protein
MRSPAPATFSPNESPRTQRSAGEPRHHARRRRRQIARCLAKENEVSKFSDYNDFSQPLAQLPSHRLLAIRRGEAEGFLLWSIVAPAERLVGMLETDFVAGHGAAEQMRLVVQDAYKRLLAPSVEVDLRVELKSRADDEAIAIFGRSLEQLLLASPAGERVVIGLDPGFRTGVKVAAVSRTGAVVATDTIYLHQPERFPVVARPHRTRRSGFDLDRQRPRRARRNSRARYARRTQADAAAGRRRQRVGASVYSASDAARDVPELDVRFAAPCRSRDDCTSACELVKIDPKSIGVGYISTTSANEPETPRRRRRVV